MQIESKGLTDKKAEKKKKLGGGLKKLGMPRGSKKAGSPPSGVSQTPAPAAEIESKGLEDIFASPASAPAPTEDTGSNLLDF